MGILRMDNVGIVVRDLDAMVAFFVDLGMTKLGGAEVEGEWSDQTTGLTGNRSKIAMLQTPDGQSRLELVQFLHPDAEPGLGAPPANTLGVHRVAFQVDDIDATLEIAARHGAAPLDRVAQYEDLFRMAYVRAPEGIIVMLAEPLRDGASEAVRPDGG